MERLRQDLDALISNLENESLFRESLEDLVSVYPFNEHEYIIASLLGNGKLSLDGYIELRDEYIARNPFLYLFEMSGPTTFGIDWAQGHLQELVPTLMEPTKELDPDYSRQYDFVLDGPIRIEVKASRAVEFRKEAPIYEKALASDSTKDFEMNFQQMKPTCCDVFVWVAVWRDCIRYWALSSWEVANDRNYSPNQHRGSVGVGQLHLRKANIGEFDSYETQSDELSAAILAAYERQLTKSGDAQ